MKLLHHYSLIYISLIIAIVHIGYGIAGEQPSPILQHPLKPVQKHVARFFMPIDQKKEPSPMQLFNHNFDRFCLDNLNNHPYMSALQSRCQHKPKLLRKFAIKAKKRKRAIEKHVQNSTFATQIRADLQIKAAAFLLSHWATPTAPLPVENNEPTQNVVSALLNIKSATSSHRAVSKSLTRHNRLPGQNIQVQYTRTRTCLPPKRFRVEQKDTPADNLKKNSSRTKKRKRS